MKRLPILILGLLFSVLSVQNVQASILWKVGVSSDLKPFVYYNEDRELTGIDIDIITLLAEEEDAIVEYQEVPFDELLDLVKEKNVNFAISAITITEERQEQVDFTESYFTTCARVITLKDSEIHSIEDLYGKTVAVINGSDDEDFVLSLDNVILTTFEKDNEIRELLVSGSADAVVLDERMASYVVETNEELVLLDNTIQEEHYAIALPKEQEYLMNKLNDDLATLQETGEMDQLFQKYIQIEEAETE